METETPTVGRVARLAPQGDVILAYFFGPRRKLVPKLDEIEHLEPSEAFKVIRVSELGLVDGRWPIIGDSSRWERERWPIPAFIRREPMIRASLRGATITPKAWRVVYSEDDPNSVPAESCIAYETDGLEPDRLYGHRAAEVYLSQILGA
jgi:hypothetical protein